MIGYRRRCQDVRTRTQVEERGGGVGGGGCGGARWEDVDAGHGEGPGGHGGSSQLEKQLQLEWACVHRRLQRGQLCGEAHQPAKSEGFLMHLDFFLDVHIF